jgi:hypothetical protein
MKVFINRHTGQIEFSTKPAYTSEHMVLFGHVDSIPDNGGMIWYPDFSQIESFLDQNGVDALFKDISSMDGQFLLFWFKEGEFYFSCDRYCINTIYYRISTDTIELFDRILGQENNLVFNRTVILSFLLFGYLPGRQTLFQDISRIMPGEYFVFETSTGKFHVNVNVSSVYPKIDFGEYEDDGLVAEKFHKLFREALEKRINEFNSTETLLIPLSGGFDSRYVLGTTLELVSPSRIKAMTYGQKGSYDFEIGKLVAKTAGVRHLAYPITSDNYAAQNLRANCLDTDGQIFFATEAPVEIYQSLTEYGKIILSGYVGDAVMGDWLRYDIPSSRKDISIIDARVGSGDPLIHYLDDELIQSSFYYDNGFDAPLDPVELWYFINHFTKYTNYCVFKHREHFTYISPFIDFAFIDFILNLPKDKRMNRSLYFSWMRKHFMALADLPCSYYRGVSLSSSAEKKYLARQWDHILRYGLGINRSVNKFDLFHCRRDVLGQNIKEYPVYSKLPSDFSKNIYKSKYYFLQYSLKSLDVLCTDFNIRFI